jgi:hypothetical protein
MWLKTDNRDSRQELEEQAPSFTCTRHSCWRAVSAITAHAPSNWSHMKCTGL